MPDLTEYQNDKKWHSQLSYPADIFSETNKLNTMQDANKINISRLALKSGIDGHPESSQVGHSRSANTAQRLNSVDVVASSD